MKRLRNPKFEPALGLLALILIIGQLYFSPALTRAEESDLKEELALPQDLPPLPEPKDISSSLIVSKKNAALFHELLLAPIASWLKENNFYMRVVRRAGYAWEFPVDWQKASSENSSSFSLEGSGIKNAEGSPAKLFGLPFGTAAQIDKDTDPKSKAYKILWNSRMQEMQSQDLLYGSVITWVGAQNALRRTTGVFYRRFYSEPHGVKKPPLVRSVTPTPVSPNSTTTSTTTTLAAPVAPEVTLSFAGPGDVMQQEVLDYFSPSAVFGMASITWRYRGAEDDLVWLYSPVIGKSRQVFGANRSDPILGGVLTIDDLFCFSTKLQSVEAKVVGEKALLVPLPSLTPLKLVMEPVLSAPNAALLDRLTRRQLSSVPGGDAGSIGKALTVRGAFQREDGVTSSVQWNYDTREFPQGAPWIPTSVLFAPREVWILELSPLDPYYLAGRQILVVDKETMLPVYKVVYDRAGAYQKTVVSAWSRAISDDKKTSFPVNSFTLVVDKDGTHAMTVSADYVRTFQGADNAVSGIFAKLFDITAHEETKKSEPEVAPTGTPPGASPAANGVQPPPPRAEEPRDF